MGHTPLHVVWSVLSTYSAALFEFGSVGGGGVHTSTGTRLLLVQKVKIAVKEAI